MISLNSELFLHHYTAGSYQIVSAEIRPCEFSQACPRNSLHAHDSFEVCFVRSGTGRYIEEQTEYALSENTLFLGRPFVKHEIILTSEEPMLLYYCNFVVTRTGTKADTSKEGQIIDRFLKQPMTIVQNCRHLNAFLPFFSTYTASGGCLSLETVSKAFLLEVMQALSPKGTPVLDAEDSFKAGVSRYLSAHLNEKITSNMLAEALNVSPRSLFYLFKKNFGSTPVQYINQTRISSAILYLRMGFSITQVAALLGFSEVSAFSRTFKKCMGVSPREYLAQPSD